MSFLSGLNSFAGGLAQGIQAGENMKLKRQDNEREERADKRAEADADRKAKDYKRGEDMRAEIAAAMEMPFTDVPHLEGPGFDSREMAASMATAPLTPHDNMSNTAAGLPTLAGSEPKTPAPVVSGPGAMPTQAPPQPVQYQDPLTQRWHNLSPDQVRPASDTDRIREVARVYYKHGDADKAEQLLTNFYQRKAVQLKVNQEESADALTRAMPDPVSFGKVLNQQMQAFGTPVEVKTVMVDGPNGKSMPALQFNRIGSATPPFYLDRHGMPTMTPDPDAYMGAAASLISSAKGDGGVGMIASLVGIDAQLTNTAIARNREARDQQMHPLDMQGKRAAIANTQANTSATVQGMGIQRNEDRRAEGRYQYEVGDYQFKPNVPKGANVTSEYRTPSHNREVGGVEDSFHTRLDASGKPMAIDLTPHAGQSIDQLFAEAKKLNPDLDVMKHRAKRPDGTLGGWHVHMEPKPTQLGLSPRDQRTAAIEGTKNVRERLEKVRDRAATIAAVNSATGIPNEGEIRGAMLQLINTEPPEVKNAFRQMYASELAPFIKRGQR